MDQSDSQKPDVCVFRIDFFYLEGFLLFAATVLFAAIRDPADFHLNAGGLVAYHATALQYWLVGAASLLLASSLALFLRTLARYGKFARWNPRGQPFVRLREDALVLFGETTIAWSSIASVRQVKTRLVGPYRTYVVLELAQAAHARLDRPCAPSMRVAALLRKKYGVGLGAGETLCVALDDQNGATLPSDEIVARIEQFRSGAPTSAALRAAAKLDPVIMGRTIVMSALTAVLLTLSALHLQAIAGRESARENWPTVDATILLSKVIAHCANPAESFPSLRYRYAVSGTGYLGSKIDGVDLDLRTPTPMDSGKGVYELAFPTAQNRCVAADVAAAQAARYPQGAAARVYYNPAAPYESMLVKSGIAARTWAEIAAVALLAAAIVYIASIYLRVAFGGAGRQR